MISKSSSVIFNKGTVDEKKNEAFINSKSRTIIKLDRGITTGEAQEIIDALKNVSVPFVLYMEVDVSREG